MELATRGINPDKVIKIEKEEKESEKKIIISEKTLSAMGVQRIIKKGK